MSNWCCKDFDFFLGLAGEKLCSIVATNIFDSFKCFQIMARPFEKEVLDELNVAISAYSPTHQTKSGKRISIALAAYMKIHYCPMCGQNLSELIKLHEDEFDQLVSEHRQYCKAEYFQS